MGTYRMGCVRRWNIPFELRSNQVSLFPVFGISCILSEHGHIKGFLKVWGLLGLDFFFHCTESFCREPYAEIKTIFPIELWELGIRNSRNAEDLVRATFLTNKLPFISDTGVLKPLLTSKRHDKLRYQLVNPVESQTFHCS